MRLGVVGGVSWHSTASFYQRLQERYVSHVGPYRSVDLVMRSLDYGIVRDCIESNTYKPLKLEVVRAARDLRKAGATHLVLCSNTLHIAARSAVSETGLELLHVGDAVAQAAHAKGYKTLGFLGTLASHRARVVHQVLEANALQVCDAPDPSWVDSLITERLVQGRWSASDSERLVEAFVAPSVDAVILGCTELQMAWPRTAGIPYLDTMELLADYAAEHVAMQGK